MTAKYFAFCPGTGGMSDDFNYPADAEKAAIELLKESYLPVFVCKKELEVEYVDRKAGTYTVTPLR